MRERALLFASIALFVITLGLRADDGASIDEPDDASDPSDPAGAAPQHEDPSLPPIPRRAESLHIGRVNVEAGDVFDQEQASRGFIYRGANAVHISTRESTVRRFLIFAEGDVYDPAVIAEAERNLRALGLFRSVEIRASEPHDGSVDLTVRTQDAWTLSIGLSLGSDAGAMHGGVSIGEKNLVGTARQLYFGFAQDADRTYKSIEFLDPYFVLPYASAHILYAQTSDGYQRGLELRRPFYSTAAPWAGEAIYADLKRDEILYEEGGAESERFGATRLRVAGSWGLALDASALSATRLSLGLDWRRDRFRALPGQPPSTLPADREFRYVFLQYETLLPDFLKWNYVDHDDRIEDIGLGPRLMVKAGVSPAAFGVARTTGLVEAAGEAGFRAGTNGFVRGRATFDTRVASTLENAHFHGDIWLVRRFETSLRQTFVAHAGVFRGWNLDADEQFFMDGTTGMRGYRLRSFEGDRRIVLNLEQRFFSGWQIAGLVSPGFAVFADAGLIGSPTRPLRLSQVKTDVGVGLRFAVAWAPLNNVFRIDAAYALQPDPLGRKGWLISFSSGQAF